jgi:hypothetical protein
MKIDLVEKPFNPKFKGKGGFTAYDEYIYLELYLKKKYAKNLYSIPFTDLVLTNELSAVDKKTRFIIVVESGLFFIPDEDKKEPIFIEFINKIKNVKKRFTYYNSTQHFTFKNEVISHSSAFIYDSKTNTIDHFDSIPNHLVEKYQKKYINFFKMVYGNGVVINFSRDRSCTYFGRLYYQKCSENVKNGKYVYTTKGFCGVWTMWYLEYRLANPDFSPDELIKEALKVFGKPGDKICKFIRGYAKFYTETIEKFDIIKDSSNNKRIIEKI